MTHTDTVSVETAEALARLGAFEGRGFRPGDIASYKASDIRKAFCVIVLEVGALGNETNLFVSKVDPKQDFPRWHCWVDAANCILLPRIGDLMDALESYGYKYGVFRPQGNGWKFDTEYSAHCMSGKGKTREEAAAQCLIAVLEARKGVEG